jgi:hypothetical protein
MVSFRKSLMVVALLALCAGLASAAADSVASVGTTAIIRAEGVTEPLNDLVINNMATLPAGAVAEGFGTYAVTIFSTTVPITSNPGHNLGADGDIVLTTNQGAYHGVISAAGTSVTFAKVQFTGAAAGAQVPMNLTVSGIRVNASSLLTGGPAFASGVSFTIIASPADIVSPPGLFGGSPIYNLANVAYAIPTFSFDRTVAAKLTFSQCGDGPLSSPDADAPSFTTVFTLLYTEQFSKSFLTKTDEGLSATQGTRLSATFTGFPDGTKLWVPTQVRGIAPSDHMAATMVVGPSADGSGGALATTSTGIKSGGIYWVGVTQGTQVVYEVTEDMPGVIETLPIPVAVSFTGTTAPPLASFTSGSVLGNYAPQSTVPGPSATAPIPRFTSGGTAKTGYYGIVACTTTLLFPYVTVGGGWNVGLAVSNTSAGSDTVGTGGTCAFSFYGATGAPAAPVTLGLGGFADTALITPGTTGQDLASAALDAGATFTGYAYALCNFKNAQGFAFPFASEAKGYISTGYLAIVNPYTE